MLTIFSWRLNSSSRSSVVREGKGEAVAEAADVLVSIVTVLLRIDTGEACCAALAEVKSKKPRNRCVAMMLRKYASTKFWSDDGGVILKPGQCLVFIDLREWTRVAIVAVYYSTAG
jgi:hypothetical protein